MNSLTVQTVGLLLGAKLPPKGMARCPLPAHNDVTASFEIRPSGLRWICYGCNEKGGAIDLVAAIRGSTFLEAKRWLAEATGLVGQPKWQELQQRPPLRRSGYSAQRTSSPERLSSPNLQPPSQLTSIFVNDVFECQPDHELYAALFAVAPILPVGRNYLHGRCLSDQIISRFAVGQMPDIGAITELVRHFGFERIEAGGLLTKKSTHDRYWPIFPTGALLFPYTEGGRIAYLQARIITKEVQGSRWRNLNNRRRRLFNTNILSAPDIRRVGICEGAIDVLSAAQLGCEAIGLIGVGAQLTNTQIIALRGRQVDLLLDWDKAGDERAVTLRKELARFGVAATRKTAPRSGAKDVNDYLRQGNTSL